MTFLTADWKQTVKTENHCRRKGKLSDLTNSGFQFWGNKYKLRNRVKFSFNGTVQHVGKKKKHWTLHLHILCIIYDKPELLILLYFTTIKFL